MQNAGYYETGYSAEPIFFKSNLIINLVSSDGLIHIPPQMDGLYAGEIVRNDYLLWLSGMIVRRLIPGYIHLIMDFLEQFIPRN
ncbi:MAG: hypothetical protein GYA15_08970 [Leptolinea sp.]|nr:hypothetical protein [Leptolinea sp.]